LSKLQSIAQYPLVGNLFQTAVCPGTLAVESRAGENIFISILDLKNGECLQQFETSMLTPWHHLVAVNHHHLIFQHFENRQNPDTVRILGLDRKTLEINAASEQEISAPNISTPQLYLPNQAAFQTVRDYLDEPISLGCEYLEHSDKIILSYHVALTPNSFMRKLKVLNGGQQALDVDQDRDLKGFAPGSFFVFENRLVFVRNKTEVNLYEI
jgi:hypothetical protein